MVRDEGRGIPERQLDEVFALFHRAEPTARTVAGCGIGLFVVCHPAEAMGGRAWALNGTPTGPEVGFSLPVATEAG